MGVVKYVPRFMYFFEGGYQVSLASFVEKTMYSLLCCLSLLICQRSADFIYVNLFLSCLF